MSRIPKSKKPLTPESIVNEVQVQVTVQFKSSVLCSTGAPLSLVHKSVGDDAINKVHRLLDAGGPEGLKLEIVGDPKVILIATAIG